MGSDFFCSLTGAYHLANTTVILDQIKEEFQQERGLSLQLRDAVSAGLVYSQEDVEASKDFVLLTPCRKENGGVVEYLDGFDLPEIGFPLQENDVAIVFDVTHGYNPDLGDYIQRRNDEKTQYFTVISWGKCFLMTFTSYQILRHVCPELQPHHLYNLFLREKESSYYRNGAVNGVDYGPLADFHSEQYVYWLRLADLRELGDKSRDRYSKWWLELVLNPDKTESEILNEAWLGKGNMWAIVRPDRFPVQEAARISALLKCDDFISSQYTTSTSSHFEALPFDIYHLLCEFLPMCDLSVLLSLSRRIRSTLLPHVNAIAYQKLKSEERWHLPVPNLPPLRKYKPTSDNGRAKEEMEYWIDEWSNQGIEAGNIINEVPWLNYAKLRALAVQDGIIV
ncbi:hypothetical protein AX16_006030 [Volvariella volvacea WC 439]|nr:hypothetical protein AX16_006030 [Volvariella volvacea WC 439]